MKYQEQAGIKNYDLSPRELTLDEVSSVAGGCYSYSYCYSYNKYNYASAAPAPAPAPIPTPTPIPAPAPSPNPGTDMPIPLRSAGSQSTGEVFWIDPVYQW